MALLALPLTTDSVSSSLQILLSTHDPQIRRDTNLWLSTVFRPSKEAWTICLHLLFDCPASVASSPTASDIQVFAAQTLLTKLNEHVEQLLVDQTGCLEFCRLLTTQCLLQPTPQRQYLHQPEFSKSVRVKLSECLAVAVASCLGAHWSSAISDILSAAQQQLFSISSPSRLKLITFCNFFHTLSSLPQAITRLEYQKQLMARLGHPHYTPWRKTKAAKTVKSETGRIGEAVAAMLDHALTRLQQQQENGTSEPLATEVIHAALVATTNWTKTFNTSFVTFTSIPASSSTQCFDAKLVWKLISVYAEQNDALPEMLCTLIPILQSVEAQPKESTTNHHRHDQHPTTPSTTTSCESFTSESLGTSRTVIELVLVFFVQKLLSPLTVLCQGNITPQLDFIETFGGREFLYFVYHWITVVYDLALAFPSLLLHQSNDFLIHLPLLGASQEASGVVVPSNLLFQLLRLASLFHPVTHLKLLELWNDVSDLYHDHVLLANDVNLFLAEFGEITLTSILTHSRRDSPTWDPNSSSRCSDPSDKDCYIESSQDAVIKLYCLYCESSDPNRSSVFVQQLTSNFTRCCDHCDHSGAAAVLALLGAIVETAIDLSKPEITNCLLSVCQRLPLDTECVELLANIIKTQSVFLTADVDANLWTSMFECLMRVFRLAPRLCAEGVCDLCDCGGKLGLQQVPNPTELIRNFYMLIESLSNSLPPLVRVDVDSALFGALSALIRQLGPVFERRKESRTSSKDVESEQPPLRHDTPQVIFAESLRASIIRLESLLPDFLDALATVDLEQWNGLRIEDKHAKVIHDGILLLRRLSRSINAFESKLAESLGTNLREIRQSFVQSLLFGGATEPLQLPPSQQQPQQQPQRSVWRICCTAAGALLLRCRTTNRAKGLIVPASDCYEKQKLQKKVWAYGVTSESGKNLALHFLRQTIRSTCIADHWDYWDFMGCLILHHLQQTDNAELIDLSVAYALTDIIRSLIRYRSEDVGRSDGSVSPRHVVSFVDLPIVLQLSTTLVPCLLRNAFVKAQSLPVSLWGFTLKPLFDLAGYLMSFWEISESKDEQSCGILVQMSVKALECPSKRIQRNVFLLLAKLLNSKNPFLRGRSAKLYPEMVNAFWCTCHLWESPNMTAICNLAEALIRFTPSSLPSTIASKDGVEDVDTEFIKCSRIVMTAMKGKVEGLMSVLSDRDCTFVLDLFKALRSMRLRQLLMDLVKIGKQVQTPDSLIAYEIILHDLPTTHQAVKTIATERVVVDLELTLKPYSLVNQICEGKHRQEKESSNFKCTK